MQKFVREFKKTTSKNDTDTSNTNNSASANTTLTETATKSPKQNEIEKKEEKAIDAPTKDETRIETDSSKVNANTKQPTKSILTTENESKQNRPSFVKIKTKSFDLETESMTIIEPSSLFNTNQTLDETHYSKFENSIKSKF